MRILREYFKIKKRFLVVGDNHLDTKTPRYRVDDYLETGLAELEETLLIAEATKTDYYILLGDVFNRIDVGGECRNRAINILASNNGVPWSFKKYIVVGNHDIAHNPNFMIKSAIQSLVSAGVVNYEEYIENLPVKFFHFEPDLDEKLKKGELENYTQDIIFLHASIVDKPTRFDHVLFSDLKAHPNTKLIISGHIHSPMESENNKTRFINPGSLGRSEVTENHQPHVLLFQYDFDLKTYEHKYLKLKNSLPFDVVFDIEKSTQKKDDDKHTEMFIQTVTNVELEEVVTGNLANDFMIFAQKRNMNDDIINIVINTMNVIKTGGNL